MTRSVAMSEDFPFIHAYTRAQALEDGVLVDLSARAPDTCRSHFIHPLACTSAVWCLLEATVKREPGNSLDGVLHGVLTCAKLTARIRPPPSPDRVVFKALLAEGATLRSFTLQLACGPGDMGEPVLTLMLRDED
jgi:hypothetical protein